MAQDFKKVAIVGGGPAGCICAYYLLKENIKVDIFEKTEPLKTLLPTGGGRCNLANAEYDFKTLASNYPRGEKFLYSIFSKFSTIDTINLFEELGIKTYCQDDMRIFPTSNSSKDVRNKILSNLNKEALEQHLASSKDGTEEIKARRILERINQLTDNITLISKNLRK